MDTERRAGSNVKAFDMYYGTRVGENLGAILLLFL